MLIDIIYDSGKRLVWSGEAEPKELFTDLFIRGLSTLRVVVERDDLTPFDPAEEAKLSASSQQKINNNNNNDK